MPMPHSPLVAYLQVAATLTAVLYVLWASRERTVSTALLSRPIWRKAPHSCRRLAHAVCRWGQQAICLLLIALLPAQSEASMVPASAEAPVGVAQTDVRQTGPSQPAPSEIRYPSATPGSVAEAPSKVTGEAAPAARQHAVSLNKIPAAKTDVQAAAAPLPTQPPPFVKHAQPPMPMAFIADPGAGDQFIARAARLSMRIAKSGFSIVEEQPVKTASPAGHAAASEAGAGMAPKSPGKVQVSTAEVSFLGANASAQLEGLSPLAAKTNYFVGKDPAKWSRNLTSYTQVRASGVYPGIDAIYYGAKDHRLEYDLVVAPGADPAQIHFRVDGSHHASLDASGNLRLDDADGTVLLNRPVLYQDLDRGKRAIEGSYVQLADQEFGFKTEAYDRSKPLIIDPTINLVYSTYAGGIHDDQSYALTVDAAGNTYLTGEAASQDFPVTGNALQTTRQAIGTYTYDVIVMKFDPSGTLLFSTFLGGTNNESGNTLVIDSTGDVYVGGGTNSSDFPVTSGAYQSALGGGNDAFLAEISPDGSQLLYSTYLGGTGDEYLGDLLMNSDGSLWIAGGASAPGLPVSSGAFQSKPNGTDNYFIAKAVFQSGSLQLPYLTFLGGSNTSQEANYGLLAADSSGNVYLAGATHSGDYPVTANAYQKPFPLSNGCFDSPTPNTVTTLAKFSPDLSQMLYSTVLGGTTEAQSGNEPVCNQFPLALHLDGAGNMWMAGTVGMSNFPVTANAISSQLNGNGSAGVDYFIAELSADGSKELYGSYLGGSQYDYGVHAAWDASGNIWLHGNTASTDYPVTTGALQTTNGGGYDTTVTELSPDGSKILYSTYLGGSGDDDVYGQSGIAIDANQNIHLSGETASANFPVSADALQGVFANGDQGADGADVYYAELGTGAIGTIGPLVGGNAGDTSVTIGGAGFQQGATCSIVQGTTTITSVQAVVNASGTSITCILPLTGAVTGSYSVVVSNPDGSSFTKDGAFTVQSGGAPVIWSDVVGRPEIRVGSPSTFYAVVGNSGQTDAYFTEVWISIPGNFSYALTGGYNVQYASSTFDLGPALAYTDDTGVQLIPFMISHLAPGQSVSIPLQLTAPDAESAFSVDVYTRLPWFDTLSAASQYLNNLANNPAALGSTCAGSTASGLNNCADAVITEADTDGLAMITTSDPTADPTTLTPQLTTAMAQQLLTSVTNPSQSFQSDVRSSEDALSRPKPQFLQVIAVLSGIAGILGFGFYLWDKFGPKPPINCVNPALLYQTKQVCKGSGGTSIVSLFLQCPNGPKIYIGDQTQPCRGGKPIPPSSCSIKAKRAVRTFSLLTAGSTGVFPFDDSGSGDTDGNGSAGSSGGGCSGSGGSIDPNYKAGPGGDGSSSQYIPGTAPLRYTVGFENEPSATLPAAQVVVTDQLDPTKVDLSTLSLGTLSFGSNVINLPSGSTNYTTVYPLSSSLNVRIQGSLDSSGLLKWTFTSIDPSTGLPPTDPTVGFLPPDTDGIQGQGNVLFQVMPKSGQSTGTQVTNMATVVFDTNAPINTASWLNTLDVDAPVSTVTALPAQSLATFTVSWYVTYKGSGISGYSVYVSDNGGAFTPWQTNVTTTSASYTGTVGHTYGFYSIAVDGAGNVQAAKTTADTQTAVVTQIVPASFVVAASPSTLTATAGTPASATITVTPAGGFNQAITFACSGLPAHSTCSFSPSTVTPSGSPTTTTLTVSTDTNTSAKKNGPLGPTSSRRGGDSALALLMLGMFGLLRERRRFHTLLQAHKACACLMAAMLLAGTLSLALTGCGGSDHSTPSGTSTITITATSGGTSETTTLQLTVK